MISLGRKENRTNCSNVKKNSQQNKFGIVEKVFLKK